MNPEITHIASLIRLIKTLRGENGCPWDRKQTPDSLAVYLVEEVYELVDAILSGEPAAVCEELGDVLFQVLFTARLFEESGEFDIEDAARMINEKMVRRHPHVFGEEQADNAGAVRKRWQEIKQMESTRSGKTSLLNSIPVGLPALLRAYRISERAAGTGFDWNNVRGVMDKAEEEWSEFCQEMAETGSPSGDKDRLSMEFGDVLFTLVNVARLAGIHPETSLAQSIRKFEKRFSHMEQTIAKSGRNLESASRGELDRLWEQAKKDAPENG